MTPYLSQISIFAFNFAPKNWAQCNGQLLPINQNQALFSLMGTTYGGNGIQNFQLPNLQGRTALHFGNTIFLGQAGGEENHTLLLTEMPQHTHTIQASQANADQTNANGNLPAKAGVFPLFHTAQNGTTMAANTLSNTGGGQSHSNLQPFLVLNFCIALTGIFPSRN